MAQFILAPSGSHGDVHPFIAIGRALAARGHRVVINTSAHFEPLARAAGFEFEPVGTEQDYQDAINDPNLWHPSNSLKVLFGGERFRRMLREAFDGIRRRYVPGDTVLAAGSLAVGARLAQEALGTPLATVHLQPMAYPSVADPPVFPTFHPKAWWPRWWIRGMYWIGERWYCDPLLAPPVNELRAELGLPPIKRIWGHWRHSPQLILGLFPDWFGRARDWPPHFHCTGFVRYDQADARPTPPEVEAFLHAGEPPVIVSFGSAMRTGRPQFEAALAACQSLGLRCLLLAKGGEQIPANLPPQALHADYAPFSWVFPRAKVVMHHGGIGTCAQALAAGVPQFVMPLAFDQFDNATRLASFGVARGLPVRRFTAAQAAGVLQELLADPDVPRNCRALQEKMADDPMPRIVELLESLIGRDQRQAAQPRGK